MASMLEDRFSDYGDWGYVDSPSSRSVVEPPMKSKSELLREKKQKDIKTLESMDIEDIEQFLREKKLKRISNNIKNK